MVVGYQKRISERGHIENIFIPFSRGRGKGLIRALRAPVALRATYIFIYNNLYIKKHTYMVTGNEQDIENLERKTIYKTMVVGYRKGFQNGSHREYFHSFFYGILRTWEERESIRQRPQVIEKDFRRGHIDNIFIPFSRGYREDGKGGRRKGIYKTIPVGYQKRILEGVTQIIFSFLFLWDIENLRRRQKKGNL